MATGGLSLVAEGLFDRATADEDVCTIALRGGSAASSSTAAPEKSAVGKAADGTRKAVRKTGEAVQGALKKLFGR
jgi:hypothetical protein